MSRSPLPVAKLAAIRLRARWLVNFSAQQDTRALLGEVDRLTERCATLRAQLLDAEAEKRRRTAETVQCREELAAAKECIETAVNESWCPSGKTGSIEVYRDSEELEHVAVIVRLGSRGVAFYLNSEKSRQLVGAIERAATFADAYTLGASAATKTMGEA